VDNEPDDIENSCSLKGSQMGWGQPNEGEIVNREHRNLDKELPK
jgi:hypothetical protein